MNDPVAEPRLSAAPGTPPVAMEVVEFWRDAGPSSWFTKNAQFDEEFKRRYLDLHMAAARREHDDWLADPYGNLALILLLDQFPRNAFRGTAHMYATDGLARYYAGLFHDAGYMEQIDRELALFACVPFIHSEVLADQVHALDLYRRYAPDAMEWAIDHHEIIRRFGRFPHRNSQLGRLMAPDEQKFLDEGGFGG